jgi:hypothetical protein
MAFVSIYMVGRLNHPYDHPASRDFFQVGKEENLIYLVKEHPFWVLFLYLLSQNKRNIVYKTEKNET